MRTWKSPIGILIEGEQTGDGRLIAAGATEWMDLPLPLIPIHGSDESIGNVTSIERKGKFIVAAGTLDDQTERGAEMARQMDEGTAPMGNRWGVSIEPDDYAFEIIDTQAEVESGSGTSDENQEGVAVIASFVGRGALPERVRLFDGQPPRHRPLFAAAGDGEPSGVVVYEDAQDNVIERVTRLRIRALAGTTTPAFADAYIELDPVDVAPPGEPVPATMPEDVVAASYRRAGMEVVAAFHAAASLKFPRAAFEQPEPDYVTPFTINDDGSWFGHVHEEGACHIGYPGRCVQAPPSPTGYEFFNRRGGVVDLTDGASLRVSAFMWNINHAPLTHTVAQVDEHYDPYANTKAVFGFGRVREGRHGPFACGVLRPDLTASDVTLLKACGQVSGDWRDGELYACQAVPRPGLPIERRDLAASGAHHCDTCTSRETAMLEELYDTVILAPRRQSRFATLRERIHSGRG